MLKLFTEEAKFDPSERAEDILDYILNETSEITQQERKKKLAEVPIQDALQSESILKQKELTRMQSRVLFVTKNPTVLDTDSVQQMYFKNLNEVFDEVHVIVLGFKKRKTDSIRLAPKVWVYPTSSRSFLRQPFTAFSTAKQQLQFTDGFRADVVVALDPFESGIAGYFIAQKFKRPFQLHITEDFYAEGFEKSNIHNKWRLRFSRYILKRTNSVRVNTDLLKQKITDRYKKIKDIELLPRYFNLKETIAQVKIQPVEKLYPQFAFTILYVGALSHNSTLFRAIDAVRAVLRTPSIGFVIIGRGAAKEEFQERTRLLGVDSQIIFKPMVDDIVAHMRASNLLICTDTTRESDEVVVKAAAAGLPIVMARTSLREDLFTDGVNSFLCDPTDTQEFTQKIVKFLNANALRSQFSNNAREVVTTRIAEDPHIFYLALRDSIESAFYVGQSILKETKPKQQKISLTKEESKNTTVEER